MAAATSERRATRRPNFAIASGAFIGAEHRARAVISRAVSAAHRHVEKPTLVYRSAAHGRRTPRPRSRTRISILTISASGWGEDER